MAAQPLEATEVELQLQRSDEESAGELSKKEQIQELFLSGIEEIGELARRSETSPSYVGQVLREAELRPAYFDLYTSTRHEMNAYSKIFAGRLQYKDVQAARQSVAFIEHVYRAFEERRDRAGQHHAMTMALTMANRARFGGKEREAAIFAAWLQRTLSEV